MKNLIYILIIIVSFSTATFGQDFPRQGDYIKDEKLELDKFVGTWEFESGNETFRIVLTKRKVNFRLFYADRIVGWHTYIKDGLVVESTMNDLNPALENFSIIGGIPDSSTSLSITFKDISRDRTSHAVLELTPGKSDEATWFLTLLEKVTIGKKKEFVRKSITIPIKRKWVLKKVK